MNERSCRLERITFGKKPDYYANEAMLLYRNDALNETRMDRIRIVSYNIDHGDSFNTETNTALRETLKKLIHDDNEEVTENKKIILLQECTLDIYEFLVDLLSNAPTFGVLRSNKIINDRSRKYNNFEYFVVIYSISCLELKHEELVDINCSDILNEVEKNTLMTTYMGKNKGISLYRKLLDANKLLVQHVQFKVNGTDFINLYNMHLSSKPYLNFVHSYMLKKHLSSHVNDKEIDVILGDFNNKFNSYSLHVLKQRPLLTEANPLHLKLKNKSSKLRNLNKVTSPTYFYHNATDKLLNNEEENPQIVNKIIDHILYDKRYMELLTYRNNMDADHNESSSPSDHFYVDCTFALRGGDHQCT